MDHKLIEKIDRLDDIHLELIERLVNSILLLKYANVDMFKEVVELYNEIQDLKKPDWEK